jgi:flagellar biosynthesis protein
MHTPDRRAVALSYSGLRPAPTVVASGRGYVAEQIIELAEEIGIPIRDDPMLVEALASLELDEEIPADLYLAVAEALLWAYRISERALPIEA